MEVLETNNIINTIESYMRILIEPTTPEMLQAVTDELEMQYGWHAGRSQAGGEIMLISREQYEIPELGLDVSMKLLEYSCQFHFEEFHELAIELGIQEDRTFEFYRMMIYALNDKQNNNLTIILGYMIATYGAFVWIR